jgi:hypothetical protein
MPPHVALCCTNHMYSSVDQLWLIGTCLLTVAVRHQQQGCRGKKCSRDVGASQKEIFRSTRPWFNPRASDVMSDGMTLRVKETRGLGVIGRFGITDLLRHASDPHPETHAHHLALCNLFFSSSICGCFGCFGDFFLKHRCESS